MIENSFANMTERRMTEIMTQRDGLGQKGVQTETPGDAGRYLGDLKCVRESCSDVIAG
jgi:hypothetical protein